MCGCIWRYEASALFLGQLLVTQEWLICNGCCHSPAVAPGDDCTVTNAHTLTSVFHFQSLKSATLKFKMTTNTVYVRNTALTCKQPDMLRLLQIWDSLSTLIIWVLSRTIMHLGLCAVQLWMKLFSQWRPVIFASRAQWLWRSPSRTWWTWCKTWVPTPTSSSRWSVIS